MATIVAVTFAAAACSSAGSPAIRTQETAEQTSSAVTAEDGLASAYGVFKGFFTDNGEDHAYEIGFGFHPALSTTKILANGNPVSGQLFLELDSGTVVGSLSGPLDGTEFDLYFVKNAPGLGTVKPESFDRIFKVGSFVPVPGSLFTHTINVKIGNAPFPADGVNFDLDMVVVTLKGQSPLTNIVATGARTIFEKRFFRERAGASLDPVTGTRANFIETNDPLVQRGAELFVNETFGGNGRTCATCHPLGNNQTIDPAFVASLPKNDPLFVVPTGLEDPDFLARGLVRENVDGLDDPTHKFVMRSVPHTISLATSIGMVGTGLGQSSNAGTGIDGPPPDERLGWSGDGAPGRGTLNEFAFGAINQHFTKSLSRVPGVDFRLPTQEELDALEAFQLFGGSQKAAVLPALTFADPAAEAGKNSASQEGQCITCHQDLGGFSSRNFNLDTGIESVFLSFRTPATMPKDGGFGTNQFNGQPGTIAAGFGNGRFNAPPLTEAADTAPFFHDNAFSVLEDAIAFYQSPEFLRSRGTFFAVPQLTTQSIQNIGAFLRTINALLNITQVRQRVNYLANNATLGGTSMMQVSIRDTQDAIDDLTASSLTSTTTANAIFALKTVKLSLQDSMPFANNQPTVPMIQIATWLQIAENDLIAQNPQHAF